MAVSGMYNYHGFLGQALRERSLIECIKTAKLVIELLETGRVRYSHYGSRKLSLVAAIEKAHTEIVAYIQENGVHLGLETSAVLQNLEKYRVDVLENFKTLATKIKAYQIEPVASSSSSTPSPSM